MNSNLFFLISDLTKALNSLTAGTKSARLAPVGWIIRLECWAISRVAWLVRAGPSMIIN
jgi:hypothetical protein